VNYTNLIQWIITWLSCFFSQFFCIAADWINTVIEEVMLGVLGAIALIPLPDALANFTWPDAGPLGAALLACDIPQALSIIVGAFTVRFLKGLIPMIRS